MLAGCLLKSTCHAQAEIVMQLTSTKGLYERKFGRGVGGLAAPDGAAKPQLGGSDDSRGQQTAAALSQRQPHVQSQFARGCAFLLNETPPFMPLTQESEPLTGKAKSRQQDRLLGDLPSSSKEAPERARLWSLLNKATAADASEAGKQCQQHEASMQANIDEIQAQNKAIAAEQHAGDASGMSLLQQPVRSREKVEADFTAFVLKERENCKKVQPAMEKMMLLRQCRVLQMKLYDVIRLRHRLARLPPDSYGELSQTSILAVVSAYVQMQSCTGFAMSHVFESPCLPSYYVHTVHCLMVCLSDSTVTNPEESLS